MESVAKLFRYPVCLVTAPIRGHDVRDIGINVRQPRQALYQRTRLVAYYNALCIGMAGGGVEDFLQPAGCRLLLRLYVGVHNLLIFTSVRRKILRQCFNY